MRRSSPPTLALTILLAASLGCAEAGDEPLDCNAAPTVAGSATFEGEAHTFDQAEAVIQMGGTPEDPCIYRIDVEAEDPVASLRVLMDGPEELRNVQFFDRSETYIAYPGELQYSDPDCELEEHNDDCARASFDIAIAELHMAHDLDGATQGMYSLTDVDVSVSGTWTIEWVDWECN